MRELDTIAAVSTPRGKGGVAMIRISGADAIALSEKVFFPGNGKPLHEIPSNHMTFGFIKETDADGNTSVIDDGMAAVYRAPHSFTGENTVEIFCHGGVLVTETVLAACFAAGCRPAEAGEFTRRAFVNGKLSLTQAESLGALLEAKTHSQMMLSRGGMAGHLSRKISAVYERLRAVLASAYAGIDFPDEELASLNAEEMRRETQNALRELTSLAETYKAGHAIREGIKTVICGKTNVGKSSLYNRIVGSDAAIVTSVEGTTRDILTQTAPLGRVTLLLSDTAGLRESSDEVENIGIKRAKSAIGAAELIFAVFDVSSALCAEDTALITSLSDADVPVIAVFNKCDKEKICKKTVDTLESAFRHTVKISAETGEGMEELQNMTENLFECGDIDLTGGAVVADARQYAAICRAAEKLRLSFTSMEASLPLDLCCVDIEGAMSDLSELDGREVTEEIVSEIFSHFCVGK